MNKKNKLRNDTEFFYTNEFSGVIEWRPENDGAHSSD